MNPYEPPAEAQSEPRPLETPLEPKRRRLGIVFFWCMYVLLTFLLLAWMFFPNVQ